MAIDQDWLAKLPIEKVDEFHPVSGGDINDSYSLQTANHHYFMKVQPGRGKVFFDHEVEGLHLLGEVANTPKVIASGEINGDGYLIQNWVDTGQGSQFDLGKMVARVHQSHAQKFGLDHNFTAGKLPKINTWQSDWITFYLDQRLKPLVKLATENHRWNDWREKHFLALCDQFKHYYATHQVQPSLLHGDLWAGNFMFETSGRPMLIDPDVFYGDRELDIAMTTVFGGFYKDFYNGYNSV